MSTTVYYVVIFALFIAIFYFMGIRPQQKQRRAHQELMSSLKKGDRVMTAAGIYGTVKRVEETIVVLEIAKGITIKVSRRAISDIIRDSAQARLAAPEATTGTGSKRTSGSTEESADDDTEREPTDTGDENS